MAPLRSWWQRTAIAALSCLSFWAVLSEHLLSRDDLIAHVDAPAAHGLSALMVGVLRGSTQCVEVLLKTGSDPSQAHVFAGTTPLHMAAELGRQRLIRLLCRHGANSSAVTAVGGTALHSAAQVDMAWSVAALVDACNMSPDLLMLSDTTALYMAAQQGFDATVLALLSVGADIYFAMPVAADSISSSGGKSVTKYTHATDDDIVNEAMTINSEAANGATALHAAAENGHESVVEMLLSHAKVLSTTSSRCFFDFVNGQSLGVTPLHLAAEYNRPHVARVLLQHGADIDALATIDGTSALYHAISMGFADMALFLLEAGADALLSPSPCPPHTAGGGAGALRTPPLVLAIMRGRPFLPVVRAMLRRQAAGANHSDCSGLSALHMAARLEDKTSLALLLRHGGNVVATNTDQESLLHVAVAHDRLKTLYFLLERLRDSDDMTSKGLAFFILNHQNKDGNTVLHLAAAACSRHDMMMLLLKSLGNNTSSQATAFNTSSVASPLHLAAAKGCVKSVDSLLEAGFSASEVFNEQTVLITAIEHKHTRVVESLLQLDGGFLLHNNVETQTKVTDNPLLYAVVKGAAAIVQVLLDRGDDCNIFIVLSSDPSAQPSSLLDIAQRRRDFDSAKILSLHASCADIHVEL
jgi:ankyrin